MAAAAPLMLVTGATGFVGRHVLDALAVAGCRLRLIVREAQAGSSVARDCYRNGADDA